MNISIVFYSKTGNTEQAAKWIAEGAESVADTEVKLFNLFEDFEPDVDFIEKSDAVVFGAPTYYGNVCWQIKKWFDTSAKYHLAGKVGAAFSTEDNPDGGGAELAVMTMISFILVKGMLAFSGGVGFGRPNIHIGPALARKQLEQKKERCVLFGQRISTQTHKLFDR